MERIRLLETFLLLPKRTFCLSGVIQGFNYLQVGWSTAAVYENLVDLVGFVTTERDEDVCRGFNVANTKPRFMQMGGDLLRDLGLE